MELFCGKEKICIRLAEGESSYVKLAAEDLCRDIERVSFGAVGVLGADNAKIFIGTKESTGVNALPFADRLLKELALSEQFVIHVFDKGAVILGADYLGTMWGIYTFSKEHLGIEPTYLFSDAQIKKHKRLVLDEGTVSDYPRTYRFRGWFINDEDLLTSLDRSAGHRAELKINHYHIISPRVLGMVVETALRLRINLIIPASHIDIANPAEEQTVKTVTDRGLYISQHHVEPCGVISYYFKDYWKKKGRELEVSFGKYKDEYIEVWRHYVSLWSKYPHVIWQVGLRGMGDKPIWWEDSTVEDSPAAHGKCIGDAIALQHSIIKEITGDRHPITTSTLWAEGAELFTSGDLELPEGTCAVFADVATTQLMGEDFYSVPRRKGREYGIYYHVQLSRSRNHLTEGSEPVKMMFNYKNAVEKGDTYYSILNVSNLREFVYSVSLNASVVWDIDRVSIDGFTRDFCRRLYGDADIASLYKEYYECFLELGETVSRTMKPAMFYPHDYGRLPFTLMPAFDYNVETIALNAVDKMGGIKPYREFETDLADILPKLKAARCRFGALLKKVQRKAESLAPRKRRAYDTHIRMHTEFLYYEHHWAELLVSAALETGEKRERLLERALEACRCMRDKALARCTKGKWKHWYRGARVEGLQRLDVERLVEITEALTKKDVPEPWPSIGYPYP